MGNKRIVDINVYWPEIIRDTTQFGQIAVAENPEFNKLSECIFRVLEDSLLIKGDNEDETGATEYGVSRWESMLRIVPSAGDTLDDRKARILTQLNLKLPYTWRVLQQLIESSVDDDRCYINYDNDTQKLYVEAIETSHEKIDDLASRVVPMNLEVVYLPWRWKYELCTDEAGLQSVNANYKTDLTVDGKWVYELPNLAWGYKTFDGATQLTEFLPKSLDSLKGTEFTFSKCKKLKTWNTRFPVASSLSRAFMDAGLEVFDLDGDSVKATQFMYTFANCKLRVFNAKLTGTITEARYFFFGCELNKESVLRIADAIPSKSGLEIHLGVHKDHENDPEVLDAIATMEANGWKVTEQFNGTATTQTATTYGLRRKPIYAKAVEMETPDGNIERVLDWGHYVTDAEERGYMEFSSVEEAEEYYNIKKEEVVQ